MPWRASAGRSPGVCAPPVRWRVASYFMYTSRMRKSWMTELAFDLPGGTSVPVTVTRLLNAGYAGREQDEVAAHVAELAELGVPAPTVTPALYPVAPYLAAQADGVPVQHSRTSGEAEWALVVAGPEDMLLTV